MALTGSGTALGDAIWNAIKAQTGATYTPAEEAKAKAIWQAMATEVVNHIVANAVVAVNVTSVTAVTPGPGVSGPGTGTGTLT